MKKFIFNNSINKRFYNFAQYITHDILNNIIKENKNKDMSEIFHNLLKK